MHDNSSDGRQRAARAVTQVTFTGAVLLNIVDITAEPTFQGWTILRIGVSVIFAVALVSWVALWLLSRRRGATETP